MKNHKQIIPAYPGFLLVNFKNNILHCGTFSKSFLMQRDTGGMKWVKFRLESNTIMTSMDEPTIRKIVIQDLTSVPYALGVSNHMGSRATEDSRTMRIIFKELEKRQIYFLDSLVSSESICFDLAHEMHLKFCRRDAFLDNKEEPEYNIWLSKHSDKDLFNPESGSPLYPQ
jgi:hypothetical protein